MDIVRTPSEIDTVLNAVMKQVDKGGSKFFGMTYEQGIDDMWRWLTDPDAELIYEDDDDGED
jgi:hypothetical protein